MKITPEDLIIIGRFLGYHLPIDGICCGFINSWTQAVFAQEEAHFYDRLRVLEPFHNQLLNLYSLLNDRSLTPIEKSDQLTEQLSTHPFYLSELETLIHKAQEAPQKSAADVLYLELHAFFNTLQLYHLPSLHREYFPENNFVLQNDFAEIFSVVKPQRLQDKPVHLLLDKYHCFTPIRMKAFFDKLKSIATEFPQVLVIHLKTLMHQVGIKYDSSRNIWHYMDVEDFKRYPEHEEYYGELETHDLVLAIFQSLPATSSLPLQLRLWSIEPANQKLEGLLDALDGEFSITEEPQDGIDAYGNNLLHLAAMDGKMEVIQAIRIQKLQKWLNQPTWDQSTPLFYACQNGHFDIAVSLLAPEFHSDPNYPNDEGYTPLLAAVKSGHEDIVEELLKPQYQVDVTATDFLGKNVLHLACGSGNLNLVKKMFTVTSKTQLNQKDCKGRTPLYVACWKGITALVELLLSQLKSKYQIDINFSDHGTSILFSLLKIKALKPDVMHLLLAYGANPKLVDDSGSTVLDHAVTMRKTTIINALLRWAQDHHLPLNELCTPKTLRRMLHRLVNKEELLCLQSVLNESELVQLVDIQYQLRSKSIAPNQFFAPSKIAKWGIAGILTHIRKHQTKLTEVCLSLGWINEERQLIQGHPAIVLYQKSLPADENCVPSEQQNFKI